MSFLESGSIRKSWESRERNNRLKYFSHNRWSSARDLELLEKKNTLHFAFEVVLQYWALYSAG